jgi:hypothetical protein
MFININSEYSPDMKETFVFIKRIHLFYDDSNRNVFPIILKKEDIQIKCYNYSNTSFQFIISIKNYNHNLLEGLLKKEECYQHRDGNEIDFIFVNRDGEGTVLFNYEGIVLSEKKRKNGMYLHYSFLIYLFIKYISSVIIIISYAYYLIKISSLLCFYYFIKN